MVICPHSSFGEKRPFGASSAIPRAPRSSSLRPCFHGGRPLPLRGRFDNAVSPRQRRFGLGNQPTYDLGGRPDVFDASGALTGREQGVVCAALFPAGDDLIAQAAPFAARFL